MKPEEQQTLEVLQLAIKGQLTILKRLINTPRTKKTVIDNRIDKINQIVQSCLSVLAKRKK